MAARRQSNPDPVPSRRKRVTTPEAQENYLIQMAFEEAERQMLAGTASSQVLTHFLKLGSSREKREMKKLDVDTILAEAKAEQIASMARQDELYSRAIRAIGMYSGQKPVDDDPYFEDERPEYYED
jgi:hypothetical protein